MYSTRLDRYTVGYDPFWLIHPDSSKRIIYRHLKIVSESLIVIKTKEASDKLWKRMARKLLFGMVCYFFIYKKQRFISKICQSILSVSIEEQIKIILSEIPETSFIYTTLRVFDGMAPETLYSVYANVHTANFPFIKTMKDFDFSFQPGINKKELLVLNTLSFLDKKENILFVGSSGVGKTHLATAIGISCAKARNITYFITFENLMHQLKVAHHENRLENRLKFFAKYKVLIVDEIGYMPIDLDSANLFFQLIARRYEKNSTIITTNTPFSKWGEILGSVTLANAVLDRLLHHSEVISIKGPSYRLKDKRALLEVQATEE